MVALDDLPFDLLVLIFDYTSQRTLCSAALVCSAFNDAAIPLLYRALSLPAGRLDRLLRTADEHVGLLKFVKRISFPSGPSRADTVSNFASKIAAVLQRCSNCQALTIAHDMTLLALLERRALVHLPCLSSVNFNLAAARLPPSLQGRDPALLLDMAFDVPQRTTMMALRYPSASVISRIPTWLDNAGGRLTELRLTDAFALEYRFLGCLLSYTPRLRVLRLTRTLGVDVLSVMHLVPELNDLGINIANAALPRVDTVELPRLTSLTLSLTGVDDVEGVEHVLQSVMSKFPSSPISEMTLLGDAHPPPSCAQVSTRLESTRSVATLHQSTIKALTSVHWRSLRCFAASSFALSKAACATLFQACPGLTRLSTRLATPLNRALEDAASLRVLVFSPDAPLGKNRSPAPGLTAKDILALARSCASLRSVVHGTRHWYVRRDGRSVHVSLDAHSAA